MKARLIKLHDLKLVNSTPRHEGVHADGPVLHEESEDMKGDESSKKSQSEELCKII